jgi:hypothetical protein
MKYKKIKCLKCEKDIGSNTFKAHEIKCEGFKQCPICSKKYLGNTKTCSYSCSNKFFRTGENNGNWKQDTYQSTCFLHHKKECVVCGEDKIVAVHHLNENHKDNRPENLIPLCPTHHQYFHSRYRNIVEPKIISYLETWKENRV